MSCVICTKPTENSCSNCKQAFYCSVEHQKEDWKAHKTNCFPFKIEESENLGRFLVAARNIKAHEIMLKEQPLICVPSQVTGPICLGCLNEIDPKDHIICEKCSWPLCSVECKDQPEHAAECELTVKRGRKVNIQDFTVPHPLYRCLGTVRCLLLEKTDKDKWEKFQQLESLEDQRRGSLQWKADLESIGRFIPKFFETNEFSEEKIMRTIGILQVNGHEVPTTDPSHVSVYNKASYLEHSCIPNLAKSFTKNCEILLWSPKPVKKGTHLSICYSDVIWGTADRQRYLMHTKLFKCNCKRCLDPSELGTFYSALKCDKKSCDGLLVPLSLEEWDQNWQCNTCRASVTKLYIDGILERAGKDLQAMERNEENIMKFLQHYGKWLPQCHYNMCEVKIQLVQMIGKNPKDLMILPDEMLAIKVQYGRELVELYEKLAPSEVRLLGPLCFELHSGIAEMARRISLKTGLSPKEMLDESLMFVEKCVNYLHHESDLFIEGQISKQAKINRDALRLVLRM